MGSRRTLLGRPTVARIHFDRHRLPVPLSYHDRQPPPPPSPRPPCAESMLVRRDVPFMLPSSVLEPLTAQREWILVQFAHHTTVSVDRLVAATGMSRRRAIGLLRPLATQDSTQSDLWHWREARDDWFVISFQSTAEQHVPSADRVRRRLYTVVPHASEYRADQSLIHRGRGDGVAAVAALTAALRQHENDHATSAGPKIVSHQLQLQQVLQGWMPVDDTDEVAVAAAAHRILDDDMPVQALIPLHAALEPVPFGSPVAGAPGAPFARPPLTPLVQRLLVRLHLFVVNHVRLTVGSILRHGIVTESQLRTAWSRVLTSGTSGEEAQWALGEAVAEAHDLRHEVGLPTDPAADEALVLQLGLRGEAVVLPLSDHTLYMRRRLHPLFDPYRFMLARHLIELGEMTMTRADIATTLGGHMGGRQPSDSSLTAMLREMAVYKHPKSDGTMVVAAGGDSDDEYDGGRSGKEGASKGKRGGYGLAVNGGLRVGAASDEPVAGKRVTRVTRGGSGSGGGGGGSAVVSEVEDEVEDDDGMGR